LRGTGARTEFEEQPKTVSIFMPGFMNFLNRVDEQPFESAAKAIAKPFWMTRGKTIENRDWRRLKIAWVVVLGRTDGGSLGSDGQARVHSVTICDQWIWYFLGARRKHANNGDEKRNAFTSRCSYTLALNAKSH